MASLFDHLVGEQRERDREAKRLGCLQLDLGRLLNRQVGRLLAFENAAGVDAGKTGRFGRTAAVAHQTAGRGELAILVDRGQRMADS
jgi:hypothetical protein